MTEARVNALSTAMDLVDDASEGLPAKQLGTAAERVEVALEIARFIVGEELVDEEEADEEAETSETPSDRIDLAESVTVGPARKVQCEVSPGDYAYVRPGKGKTAGKPFVHIEVNSDGDSASVFLSVADARRYAAGILDACDEAEGGSPLLALVKPGA